VRLDVSDGKTEWFLVTEAELRDMTRRLKLFLVRAFDDYGSDEFLAANPLPQMETPDEPASLITEEK
jgi:hypothetical protein